MKHLVLLLLAVLLFSALPMVVFECISTPNSHLDIGIIATALLVVYPLFFIIVGWMVALDSQIKFLLPITLVAIFFLSANLIYGMNEWFYVAEYLLIAYGSMFAHIFIKHLQHKKQ